MGKVSFSCLVKLLLHLVDFISSSMSLSNPENLKPVQGLRACHLVFCFAWLQNFILYHFIILKLLVPILCLSVSFHRSCLLWHPLNVSHKSHLQQKIGSNSLSLLGCPSLASRVSDLYSRCRPNNCPLPSLLRESLLGPPLSICLPIS